MHGVPILIEVHFCANRWGPDSTITPIACCRGEEYEIDLVLRNNITTHEYPWHRSHAQYHHIKKENIGLIEVMGLAVLPARLRSMRLLEDDHPEKIWIIFRNWQRMHLGQKSC